MGKWITFLLALALLVAVIVIFLFNAVIPSKEPKPAPMIEKNLKGADITAPDAIKDADGRMQMEK